jgi:hypothetical protein
VIIAANTLCVHHQLSQSTPEPQVLHSSKQCATLLTCTTTTKLLQHSQQRTVSVCVSQYMPPTLHYPSAVEGVTTAATAIQQA